MQTPAVPDLPLRDIHLPDPVSWWPPAPGWWILVILVLVAAYIGWTVYRNWQRKRILRQLESELSSIRSRFEQVQDTHQAIGAVSVLLRRACLSYFPRSDVASLTGDDWLRFLDSRMDHRLEALGHLLTEAPYRPAQTIAEHEVTALLEAVDSQLVRLYRLGCRS